jgi:hypothetical protein
MDLKITDVALQSNHRGDELVLVVQYTQKEAKQQQKASRLHLWIADFDYRYRWPKTVIKGY